MIRIVAVLLVVVATVVAWPAAGAPVPAEADVAATVDTSPGAALSGALSVHETDLETEVEARSLDAALMEANRSRDPSRARASILADRQEALRERLTTLEQQQEALLAARANDEIGDRAFQVRAVALRAEVRATQRLLTRNQAAAGALPADVRREYGLTAASYRALQDRSANVTADEVPTSSLVPTRVSAGYLQTMTWAGDWNDSTTWQMAWNRSTVSSEQLRRIDLAGDRHDALRSNRSALEQYDDGDDQAVQEALACAREEIDRAAAAIADAQAAADRGDGTAVQHHLDEARSHLRRAADCLVQGWEAATDDGSGSSTQTRESSWNDGDTWTYNSSTSS